MSAIEIKGAHTCAVGDRDGLVVISFPEPVRFAAFDPETARQIGEQIAKRAYKIHTGRDADANKSVLADQVRGKLITRATHIARSLQKQGKPPAMIAMNIVDAVLQEVT